MTENLEDKVLEKEFLDLFSELIEYCENHKIIYTRNYPPKNLDEVRQCPAYGKIVAMGVKVLPLIRQGLDMGGNRAYAAAQIGGLISAVQKIVGEEFKIPKEMEIPTHNKDGFVWKLSCYTDRLCDYTFRWLSENMLRIGGR